MTDVDGKIVGAVLRIGESEYRVTDVRRQPAGTMLYAVREGADSDDATRAAFRLDDVIDRIKLPH